MFDKISYTWNLMGASWQVLRQDKELLLFPLLSGICCLLVLASFAVPMWATDALQLSARDGAEARQLVYYGILFLFYLCNNYFFQHSDCLLHRLAHGGW